MVRLCLYTTTQAPESSRHTGPEVCSRCAGGTTCSMKRDRAISPPLGTPPAGSPAAVAAAVADANEAWKALEKALTAVLAKSLEIA